VVKYRAMRQKLTIPILLFLSSIGILLIVTGSLRYADPIVRIIKPGVCVAILAFAAGWAAFYEPKCARERASWIVFFGVLIIGELSAISHDRTMQDKAAEAAQKDQNQHFEDLLTNQNEKFERVLTNQNTNFKTVLGQEKADFGRMLLTQVKGFNRTLVQDREHFDRTFAGFIDIQRVVVKTGNEHTLAIGQLNASIEALRAGQCGGTDLVTVSVAKFRERVLYLAADIFNYLNDRELAAGRNSKEAYDHETVAEYQKKFGTMVQGFVSRLETSGINDQRLKFLVEHANTVADVRELGERLIVVSDKLPR